MSIANGLPSELFSVNATSEFEDDEQALEALVQLKEIDFDGVFSDRETQLDDDEAEGLSISFFNEDGDNSLILTSDSESNIHISLSLTGDNISDAELVLQQISENIADIDVDMVHLYNEFEIPFTTLDLPIEDDSQLQVTGIKLTHEDTDYIIQEEEEHILISASWDNFSSDVDEIIDGIGVREIDTVADFIESLQ